MVANIEASVSIPEALLNQAEILAVRLNISQSELFARALEHFIGNAQNQTLRDESETDKQAKASSDEKRLVINQGDIYWLATDDVSGLEAGIRHPHVVIQDNVFNHSRINTVVACALTSNIKRASMPGNVLLEAGEANLLKHSVAEVSKVTTVNKAQLGEYIGSLNEERVNQILAGMRFLKASFFAR